MVSFQVQTPKLVTSYAVPPQSSFSCRPFSIRRKLSNKSSVKRQTYVAIQRPEPQVKCFVEETGGNGTSAPAISSSSYSTKDSSSPAIFMGIVPTGLEKEDEHKDPFDVLIVHKDGRVRRLASDLETQRWSVQHRETAKLSSSHEVHACFLLEFEDVKRSLFKRRQDLAALAMGDTSSGDGEPSVLLLVSHPIGAKRVAMKDVMVQIFSVPARAQSNGVMLDGSENLRHLLTVSIPDFDSQRTFESDGVQWNFHAASAGLSLSFEQGFVNFDLSQYSPTVTSQFILEDEQFSSIMRISPQSVIGAGKSIVALYDTQYQSIQRSIPVDAVVSNSASGSSDPKAPLSFVGYFAKLGIAIATKENALLAFDLSSLDPAPGSTSLKRQRDGLLIDAIGRGIGSSSAQWDTGSKKHLTERMATLGLTSSEQVDRWNQFAQDLENAAKLKNAAAFDSAVQNYFGSSDESKKLPSAEEFVNPEMTLFLLSKIFSLEESNDGDANSFTPQLTVALWPEVTCNWLMDLGHFSMSSIEIALRRTSKPRILPPFPTGSFSQALIQADPSSQHLIRVLQGPVLMAVDELAYTVKLFLNMARHSFSATPNETVKAVTNGPANEQELNGDTTNTTSTALTKLNTTETSTPQAATFTALNLALQKLHAYPIHQITTSLRSTLSRPETISLLHHLRLSLATGGYTSRISELPPSTLSPGQVSPSLDLNIIVDLLIASVDSLGPSGWISAIPAVGTASVEDLSEVTLVEDLKSEISAALAGVEEATYLSGILREYLRFADRVTSTGSSKKSNNKQDDNENTKKSKKNRVPATSSAVERSATPDLPTPSPLVQHEKLNGADLIVFAPPDAADDEDKLLPLSLAPPAALTDVSKSKIKKSTGEIKPRSNREIGYLRRKAVGKYSFERLVV